MAEAIEEARSKIAQWVERHPQAVLYDAESATVLDVASGKSMLFPWREFQAFEEKIHPETKDAYLVFLFEDGRQIALVDPGGVAFAPSTANTGPLFAVDGSKATPPGSTSAICRPSSNKKTR